jgi:hypothetical protein
MACGMRNNALYKRSAGCLAGVPLLKGSSVPFYESVYIYTVYMFGKDLW